MGVQPQRDRALTTEAESTGVPGSAHLARSPLHKPLVLEGGRAHDCISGTWVGFSSSSALVLVLPSLKAEGADPRTSGGRMFNVCCLFRDERNGEKATWTGRENLTRLHCR